MNKHGRVLVCGSIQTYNDKEEKPGKIRLTKFNKNKINLI